MKRSLNHPKKVTLGRNTYMFFKRNLEPQSNHLHIYKWLFQLDDEPNLYQKMDKKWLEITKHPSHPFIKMVGFWGFQGDHELSQEKNPLSIRKNSLHKSSFFDKKPENPRFRKCPGFESKGVERVFFGWNNFFLVIQFVTFTSPIWRSLDFA